MISIWLFLNVCIVTYCLEKPICSYENDSFMTICVQATSAYFKTTNYRFNHEVEAMRCLNCTLSVIESNNLDFYDNRIKTIDLIKSQITLLKPKSFTGLPFLEKLLLSSNRIAIISPLTFWGINRVQHLDIQNNQIASLVANGFKELRNLKNLLLRNNYIRKIENDAFNGLVALEILDLSKNHISDIKDIFNVLSSLVLLNLEENEIVDIQFDYFNNAGSLVQLILAKNQITSIPANAFLTFSRLETLNLSSNPIKSLAEGCFRGLEALEDLDLSDAAIEELHKSVWLALHNLRSLNLSNNKIKNFKTGVYSGLPELRKLNLSRNYIEEYIKTGTFSLTRLHSLDLSYNKLEDLDYKLLVDHMPALAFLELSNNPWRCYIREEMEEEFKHDNIDFKMEQRAGALNAACNDTGWKYSNRSNEESYISGAALLGINSNSHQYVLYAFILVTVAVLAYMFYVEFKNRKKIQNISNRFNMNDVQLLNSDETCIKNI